MGFLSHIHWTKKTADVHLGGQRRKEPEGEQVQASFLSACASPATFYPDLT